MSKMLFRLMLLLVLMGTVLFVSCEKEGAAELEDELALSDEAELRGELGEPHGGPEGALGRAGCLRLVFPITLNFPDGSSKEVSNRMELRRALTQWRNDNPGSDDRPSIAFPHDIELPDGTIVTVENGEQLKNFLKRCFNVVDGPRFPGKVCFQLVFPVTVVFPDGANAEAADRSALVQLVKEWRQANPDAEGRAEIAFPYTVRLRNGTLDTVETEEELRELVGSCRGDRPGHGRDFERCFKLVFPVTLSFPDGTMETADDLQGLHELIKSWREANPDAEERPELAFPQKVELADGSIVEVASKEALAEIVGDCWEDREFDAPCFRFVYPLKVELPNGRKVTVNNPQELHRAIRLASAGPRQRRNAKLVYPLEIKYADGSTKTINSGEELKAARKACGED